jgi:hypothetical protein
VVIVLLVLMQCREYLSLSDDICFDSIPILAILAVKQFMDIEARHHIFGDLRYGNVNFR